MRALLLTALLASLGLAEPTPDQVLVLYNADWSEDLDGTEAGQDSLEVARYYVEQHTDPKTGIKPYLLGLSCQDPKAKRLNQMRLPEVSDDNKLGLRYLGKGPAPTELPWSGYHIVGFQPGEFKTLDPNSLTIRVSATDDEADAVLVYGNGAPKPGYDIRRVEMGKDLVAYGFASRQAFPDGFTAWVDALSQKGEKLREYTARFYYPEQFTPDRLGPDQVRDDDHYLKDIETPVRNFLQDPANALPDGTLLRDHVLYLVVCYGLPKQVESLFGVTRGVQGHCLDRDDGSALESRLALMYHDVDRYHKVVVLPWGRGKVRTAYIASRLRVTLGGANPCRHPMAHRPRKKGKGLLANKLYPSYDYEAPRAPHFTAATRRALGDRFLYIVTRIDGRHPEIAKAQVDGALYGSRYLTPDLGWFWHGAYASAEQATEELEFLGFRGKPPEAPRPHEPGRVLFYFGDFGYSVACAADPAAPPVPYWRGFYPGSVGYAVRSHLGWRLSRRVSQLYDHGSRYPERMLDAGVTACVTSAHGAHDTSATWPDDQVLFHHLLRGYTLGECFLLSNVYLDWLQSYVGDPLYRPALRETEPDKTPPRVASKDQIAVQLGHADGRWFARIRPTLEVSPDNPEMADIAVTCWHEPDAKQTASDWRFSRRPSVVLLDLEPDAEYHYDLVLTDPYGNVFSSARALGDLTFRTGPAPPARRVLAEWREDVEGKAGRFIPIRSQGRERDAGLLADRGELHVEFTPKEPRFELVADVGRQLVVDSQGALLGGRIVAVCPPPGEKPPPVFEPGRRYCLIVRWRRDPVARQVALVAGDGREFVLGSSNRLCWLPTTLGERFEVRNRQCTVHALTVYDDTAPRPLDPLYPACFDLEGFNAADRAKEE